MAYSSNRGTMTHLIYPPRSSTEDRYQHVITTGQIGKYDTSEVTAFCVIKNRLHSYPG
jgi:hypothetical protein